MPPLCLRYFRLSFQLERWNLHQWQEDGRIPALAAHVVEPLAQIGKNHKRRIARGPQLNFVAWKIVGNCKFARHHHLQRERRLWFIRVGQKTEFRAQGNLKAFGLLVKWSDGMCESDFGILNPIISTWGPV